MTNRALYIECTSVPSVKEGNGKDLHRLHDVTNKHLQALVATKQEITESFITTMLELKLDQATKFEWQRHSRDSNDVPHYSALLEFLDLRAQAAEKAIHESNLKCHTLTAEKKCYPQTHSCKVNVDDRCVVCKLGRHHLHVCKSCLGVYYMSKW